MTQQINLYLPEFRKRRDALGLANMARILGGAAALCAVVSAWQYLDIRGLEGRLQESRAALATASAETARLMESIGARTRDQDMAASVRELEEGLRGKQVLLEFLQGSQPGNTGGFSGHLADLSRFLVPGLRLTRVELRGGGEQVLLGGEVTRAENVPMYLQNLARGPSYSGKTFETLSIGGTSSADRELLTFSVSTLTRGAP